MCSLCDCLEDLLRDRIREEAGDVHEHITLGTLEEVVSYKMSLLAEELVKMTVERRKDV